MKDIVIKGKYVVHIIYVFVIFILIVLLLAEIYKIRICINPQQDNKNTQTGPKVVDVGNVRTVQTSSSTTTTQPSKITTSTTKSTTTNASSSSQSNDTTTEPEPPPETAEPGKIKFTIEDVTYEIKGEDWATLTGIKYKIENGKDDFYPIIQVFLYDENDPQDVKTLEQDKIELPLVEQGEVVTKESSVHVSYNNIDKEKTLRLILRNELGTELKIALERYTTE